MHFKDVGRPRPAPDKLGACQVLARMGMGRGTGLAAIYPLPEIR